MNQVVLKLGDAVDILSGFAFQSELFNDSQGLPVVRIRDVVRGFSNTRYSGDVDERFIIKNGDILIGMDGNFNVARWGGGAALLNQRVCKIEARADILDDGFLFHLLPKELKKIEDETAFVTVKHLSVKSIRDIRIALPPLTEQRRIAAILDQANTLLANRKKALVQLESLTHSIFIEMFGDPATNPMSWPDVRLKNVLSMPLRNGLSPSNSGTVFAKVLTLSAITGNEFDALAWKKSTFQATPPTHQSVNEQDFLICRGNGNVRLVGKGYFPTSSTADVTFPDTMIAARISQEYIAREYLQHLWHSDALRRQIEASARTTNGTFKVNQTMLEELSFMLPPLPRQRAFAIRFQSIEALKTHHRDSLTEIETLFASLQHRAFRGEL